MKELFDIISKRIKGLETLLNQYEFQKDYTKCLKIESGIFYLENVLIDINHLMTKGEN